jgi:Tfp pilus assembly protein PilN
MKQDINLMPEVERKTDKVVKAIAISLLVILLLGAGIYFGIVEKVNQKATLQAQFDHYTKQIEDYGDIEQQYSNLKAQKEQVDQMLSGLDTLKEDIQWTNLWKEIDSCLPQDVVFSGLSYTGETIEMVGVTGLNDVTLSATMNKLRKLEDIADVTIGSYSESGETQSFNMTLSLVSIIPIEEATDANDEAVEGGE